jgi:hypothetical protein
MLVKSAFSPVNSALYLYSLPTYIGKMLEAHKEKIPIQEDYRAFVEHTSPDFHRCIHSLTQASSQYEDSDFESVHIILDVPAGSLVETSTFPQEVDTISISE